MIELAGRHEAEQRPGALRGGARCLFVSVVVELIARSVLAPAAVLVLDSHEPIHRFAEFFGSPIDAGGIERTEHRPGAVDVIHSPAAEPAAVFELSAAQITDRLCDARVLGRRVAE